jgi:hypothetical protein
VYAERVEKTTVILDTEFNKEKQVFAKITTVI